MGLSRSKLPALAFFPVDSAINRRAVDAMKATARPSPLRQPTQTPKRRPTRASSAPLQLPPPGSHPLTETANNALHVVDSPHFNLNQLPTAAPTTFSGVLQVGQLKTNSNQQQTPSNVNPFLRQTTPRPPAGTLLRKPTDFTPFAPSTLHLQNFGTFNSSNSRVVDSIGQLTANRQNKQSGFFQQPNRVLQGTLSVGQLGNNKKPQSFFGAMADHNILQQVLFVFREILD